MKNPRVESRINSTLAVYRHLNCGTFFLTNIFFIASSSDSFLTKFPLRLYDAVSNARDTSASGKLCVLHRAPGPVTESEMMQAGKREATRCNKQLRNLGKGNVLRAFIDTRKCFKPQYFSILFSNLYFRFHKIVRFKLEAL